MSRSILAFSLVLGIAHGVVSQVHEPEKLSALVQETLENNPEIQAALSKMEMTDQWVPQAGALADPEVTLKAMEFPGLQITKGMYANIALEQMIPYPGKLSTQHDIAFLQSEHAHHERAEKVLEILEQLKSYYAMLWFERTALALNHESQKLLTQIESSARTQYAVGRASQQDALRTSIELERVKTEEESIRQQIQDAESMLRATLNRPINATIGDVELEPFTALRFSFEELVAFARIHRPMVVHDSLSILESNLRISLMKQEYFPDLKLSVEYVTYPGQSRSSWTAMAGFTIPFAPWTLGRASARVEEAIAEQSMRRSTFKATTNMVSASIRSAYSNVKASEVKVTSFTNSILPQTEQALQATISEYETGRTSFLMVLDTYRMYQEMKMESAMAQMNYAQAIARLEHQTGAIGFDLAGSSSMENHR